MTDTNKLISIIIPVYNEAGNIEKCLPELKKAVKDFHHEILICYDFDNDSTLQAIYSMPDMPNEIRLVKNTFGRGPAYAIRSGFNNARGDVVVTMMADLSDDPYAIPEMTRKIREKGCSIVSGSRYMKGGCQLGGPRLKGLLSRLAGLSLYFLGGIGTHDSTTSFKAYSRQFLNSVVIDSRQGFELSLELTIKAYLKKDKISEVPTIWHDRSEGESHFHFMRWLPLYLRWWITGLWGENFKQWSGGASPPMLFLLTLIGTLIYLRIPIDIASGGLESSWAQVLHYAYANNWQYGIDIVWTFGPLACLSGWLHNFAPYQSETYYFSIIFQVVIFWILNIWLITEAFRLHSTPGKYATIVLFFLIPMPSIIFTGSVLVAGRNMVLKRRTLLRNFAVIFMLSIISLINFTYFLYVSFVATIFIISVLIEKKPLHNIFIYIFSFVLLFNCVWIVSGQDLFNVIPYIKYSLEIASGYNEAMAGAARRYDAISLLCFIPLFLWALAEVMLIFKKRNFASILPALVVLVGVFLTYKHGVTRFDGAHVIFFSAFLVVIPLLAWPEISLPDRLITLSKTMLLFVSIIGLAITIMFYRPVILISGPISAFKQYILFDIERTKHKLDIRRAQIILKNRLSPNILNEIGYSTVDLIYSNSQGLILINNLNYCPRPVFQSYSAYTPELLELNGKHFEKINGPKYVLIKLGTIDNRLAIADDSIAFKNIIYHYRPVLFKDKFLLFRRNLSSTKSNQKINILRRNISFDESVPCPSKPCGLIWLDFKINYTIWGQIKRLLQRSPPVFITVNYHRPCRWL
jgi:glycosyltransferase involved in cell wall biosynthesis